MCDGCGCEEGRKYSRCVEPQVRDHTTLLHPLFVRAHSWCHLIPAQPTHPSSAVLQSRGSSRLSTALSRDSFTLLISYRGRLSEAPKPTDLELSGRSTHPCLSRLPHYLPSTVNPPDQRDPSRQEATARKKCYICTYTHAPDRHFLPPMHMMHQCCHAHPRIKACTPTHASDRRDCTALHPSSGQTTASHVAST